MGPRIVLGAGQQRDRPRVCRHRGGDWRRPVCLAVLSRHLPAGRGCWSGCGCCLFQCGRVPTATNSPLRRRHPFRSTRAGDAKVHDYRVNGLPRLLPRNGRHVSLGPQPSPSFSAVVQSCSTRFGRELGLCRLGFLARPLAGRREFPKSSASNRGSGGS